MEITDNLVMLVDPVYTARKISRCATTMAMWRMTKAWLDDGENRFAYWFVPPKGHGIEHDFDPIEKDKRIITIPLFCRGDRFREAYLPTDEHYNYIKEWAGQYSDFDVLLTTRNAGAYYRQVTGSWNNFCRFMVLSERYPLLDFKTSVVLPRSDVGKFSTAMRNITNYMCFDKIYTTIEFEQKGIITESKRYLSSSMVKKLSKKVHALDSKDYLNLEWPLTPEAKESFMAASPFMVFYLQKFVEVPHQYSKIHKILSTIHSKVGVDSDIKTKLFLSNSAKLPRKYRKDMDFLDMERLPQDEFWAYLKKGNVFLSLSLEEGLPTGAVEASCLGVMGVVNKAKWSVDLFGKDYFGLIKGEKQALGLIQWIYSNREAAWQKWIEWYESHFLEKIRSLSGGQQHFLTACNDYFTNLAEQANWSYGVDAISKGANNGNIREIDVLHLKGLDTIKNPNDTRKRGYWNVIYYRLPFRWRTHFKLRVLDGWKVTGKPWILRK